MDQRPTLQQLFAYIFEELSEKENKQIEAFILDDRECSLHVSDLMQYCQLHRIYTSEDMNKHVDFSKHQFFYQMIKEGKDIPQILKDKYEYPPIEPSTVPIPPIEEINISEKGKRNRWLPFVLMIFGIGICYLIFLNLSSNNNLDKSTEPTKKSISPSKDIQSPVFSPIDNSKIEIDKEKQEDKKLDAPKQKLRAENNQKSLEIAKPKNYLAANIELIQQNAAEDIIKTIQYLDGEYTGNVRGEKDEKLVSDLLKRVSEKKSLDDTEYFIIGKHFLEDTKYSKALEFLIEVKDINIVEINWVIFQTYLAIGDEQSIALAATLFKDKLDKETIEYIKSKVDNLPDELKNELRKR